MSMLADWASKGVLALHAIALPVIALPVIALPVIALPVIALPAIALPVIALLPACARTGLGLAAGDELSASDARAVAGRPGAAGTGAADGIAGGGGATAQAGASPGGASSAAAGATPVACDRDADGHRSVACAGDDCQDDDAGVHPGAWDTNAKRGAWHTEYVFGDIPGDTRSNVSIGVDLAGVVHVTEGQAGLRYATNRSGGWITESVDSTSIATPSLALAPDGTPYIAYNTQHEVRVATHGALGWSTTRALTLNPGPATFIGSSALARDHSGRLHLVYSSVGVLQYATDDGNGNFKVAASFRASENVKPALALDSQEVPHFVFEGSDHGAALLHATRCGTAFCASPIVHGNVLAAHIAVDASNAIHVVYASALAPGQLVHTLLQADGSWLEDTVAVATSWSVGLQVGLAGSPQSLHLAFTQDFTLMAASRGPNGWLTERVAPSAYRVSLAREADAVLHIAYSDFRFDVNTYVGYATNRQLAPDGIDQNCDGVDGIDNDHDGYASLRTGGTDCDDRDAAIVHCAPDGR